jgi:DtxR family manganese transport transcriptional regulator
MTPSDSPSRTRQRPAAFLRTRADHQREIAADYVELIADLIEEKGEARCSDVAARLGVANATVVKALKRLAERGLITQLPYRAIHLTEDGKRLAKSGKRKHLIVESFLRLLGVTEATARLDAEGIEHHVSEETLRAMERTLQGERPTIQGAKTRTRRAS